MNSESVKNCPNCQAPIPAEAPQGLCPKCLLAGASEATEPSLSHEAATLPTLETIAARFPQLEILEFIGQGGMGIVFKALQPKLDRIVALKLLPQKSGADPSFCERFNREARVLARLSHPNIVAVHDFGEAGPFFFLLMEFVDGVNLRQALRAGRFAPAQALALVPKICDALQYAHEEGVLHRDIKPENLLLDARGRVKIADFGIAKLLGEAKDITLTARGGAIGTPHYMAPEQLERPHDVDQRADVYSLGVVFYEMLTGELPIGRFAPPSEKAPMDPRVDQVVLRTLEKERERRYPSAGEVKTQVEKIAANPVVPPLIPDNLLNPAQSGPAKEKLPTRPAWSRTAIVAAAVVGLSFALLIPALLVGVRVGPNDAIILFLLVGLPALLGTAIAWVALRKLRAETTRRGGRLALPAAVAWPLAVANALILLILVLFVEGLHEHSGGLVGIILVGGALILLTLDLRLLRHWLNRWKTARALPHDELRALIRRVPRRVVWLSCAGLMIPSLLFLLRPRHSQPMVEPYEIAVVQGPNAPPGYEVGVGQSPGNDDRVFRASLTVPPGYALSVAPVFLSNQVPVKPLLPNIGAVLIASEGQPVHAQLSWRLLGATTLADGAPLQFSLAFLAPQHGEKSFHLVPPEPLLIDWVSEHNQLWPPQNGHTKFLLMKGASTAASAEVPSSAEWAVAIEERLDPLPESLPQKLRTAQILLGTNWPWHGEGPLAPAATTSDASVEDSTESVRTPASEKIVQYLQACNSIDKLAAREKQLLTQFTPENAWVKSVQEELAAQRELKRQLETENPSLAMIHRSQGDQESPTVGKK